MNFYTRLALLVLVAFCITLFVGSTVFSVNLNTVTQTIFKLINNLVFLHAVTIVALFLVALFFSTSFIYIVFEIGIKDIDFPISGFILCFSTLFAIFGANVIVPLY